MSIAGIRLAHRKVASLTCHIFTTWCGYGTSTFRFFNSDAMCKVLDNIINKWWIQNLQITRHIKYKWNSQNLSRIRFFESFLDESWKIAIQVGISVRLPASTRSRWRVHQLRLWKWNRCDSSKNALTQDWVNLSNMDHHNGDQFSRRPSILHWSMYYNCSSAIWSR